MVCRIYYLLAWLISKKWEINKSKLSWDDSMLWMNIILPGDVRRVIEFKVFKLWITFTFWIHFQYGRSLQDNQTRTSERYCLGWNIIVIVTLLGLWHWELWMVTSPLYLTQYISHQRLTKKRNSLIVPDLSPVPGLASDEAYCDVNTLVPANI